jgi:hypothetical protein
MLAAVKLPPPMTAKPLLFCIRMSPVLVMEPEFMIVAALKDTCGAFSACVPVTVTVGFEAAVAVNEMLLPEEMVPVPDSVKDGAEKETAPVEFNVPELDKDVTAVELSELSASVPEDTVTEPVAGLNITPLSAFIDPLPLPGPTSVNPLPVLLARVKVEPVAGAATVPLTVNVLAVTVPLPAKFKVPLTVTKELEGRLETRALAVTPAGIVSPENVPVPAGKLVVSMLKLPPLALPEALRVSGCVLVLLTWINAIHSAGVICAPSL